jgi:trimeric autotransporter adhesin
MRSFRISRIAGALIFLASAIAVAACGGQTTSAVPTSAPSTSLTGSVVASTTASVTLPYLSASGITVSGSLPSANAAATVTETVGVIAPSGVTPYAKARIDAAAASPSPVIYVTFSSTSSVTLSAIPALTFTLSSAPSGYYYLALNTGSGWESPVSGPGTVKGDAVSFTGGTGTVAITPTQPATIALVVAAASLSSPTPSPAPVASPNELVFDESSPAPQTFSVSEAGYSGAFTESTSCSASPVPSPAPTSSPYVAQVSPSSATPASAGGSVSFTVTPGEETGSCTVTISDSNAMTTSVSVIVGLDQVIIYDRKRH